MRSLSTRARAALPVAIPGLTVAAVALAAVTLLAVAPASASRLDAVGGHLGVGYSKLFLSDAPGGSISLAGGVDLPVATDWRAGVELGYHLLGSRTVERGSLLATVDYSAFELALLAHFTPPSLGPIGRISFGPSLFSAKGELSTSGGGAAFSDLAVSETALGATFELALLSRKPAPVRMGFELGAHLGFVNGDQWKIGTARVTAYY
jgi:hypothetical protein